MVYMVRFSFRAWGDGRITARHKTTLEITKEDVKTGYGDCIVATGAERSLSDLPGELKAAARVEGVPMKVVLEAGGFTQTIRGRGDPDLSFESGHEMVVRKSGYVCGRTLMVHANRAAADLDKDFVELLKDGKRNIGVTIIVGEGD